MRRFGAFLVVALAVTATWPTGGTPRPASAEAPASVAFVGDSIGRDAQPEIAAEVTPTNPIAYYHAIGAGYTDYHLPRLLPIVQAPDGPDIVVAELGTGDAFWSNTVQQFETSMRRFLARITPYVDCVLWLDQKPGGNRAYPMINDRAVAFNRVVHRVANGHGWSDVPSWLAPALRWGRFRAVLDGFADGTFRPDEEVTRGRLVTWLWKAAGQPTGYPGDHPWPEAPQALRLALKWADAEGIVTGINGRFRAERTVDRAQIAVWLQATDAFLHQPPPAPPTTVPPTTLPPPTTVPPTTLPPPTTVTMSVPPTTAPAPTVPPTTLVP